MTIPLPPGFADVMNSEGYSRSPLLNVVSSPVDVGEPKRRMRFTGRRRAVSFTRILSASEYKGFEDWFETTAHFGTVQISVTDAIRSESGTFVFDVQEPYAVSALSTDVFQVTLNMVRVA